MTPGARLYRRRGRRALLLLMGLQGRAKTATALARLMDLEVQFLRAASEDLPHDP